MVWFRRGAGPAGRCQLGGRHERRNRTRTPTGKRAGGDRARRCAADGVAARRCDPAGGPIFLLEPRRLRICALAADHHAQRRGRVDGETGWLSAIPISRRSSPCFLSRTSQIKAQKRRSLVWPPLLVAGIALTGSFFLAEVSWVLTFVCLVISRRRHLRALRAVLRDHSRAASAQRHRRSARDG